MNWWIYPVHKTDGR